MATTSFNAGSLIGSGAGYQSYKPQFQAGRGTTQVSIPRPSLSYPAVSVPNANIAGQYGPYSYDWDINAARSNYGQFAGALQGALTPGANGQGWGYWGVSTPAPGDPTWAAYQREREGYSNLLAEDMIKKAGMAGVGRAGTNVAGMGGAGTTAQALAANAGTVAGARRENYDTTFDMATKLFGLNKGMWESLLGAQNQALQQSLEASRAQAGGYENYLNRMSAEDAMNYNRQQEALERGRANSIQDKQMTAQSTQNLVALQEQERQSKLRQLAAMYQGQWGGWPGGTEGANVMAQMYGPSGHLTKGPGNWGLTYA